MKWIEKLDRQSMKRLDKNYKDKRKSEAENKKNLMWWLNRIYSWLWYNIQSWWIKSKRLRRPFTFMMRDFYVDHPGWAAIITLFVTASFLYVNYLNCWWGASLIALHFAVLAHLWWGTPHRYGEQEDQEYIEH